MKPSYKQRLFLYFAIIFAIFAIGVITFEQSREKTSKTDALADKLDAYTEIINAGLLGKNDNYTQVLVSLIQLFPQNLRVSLIDKQGNVLFDNTINDLSKLENHIERPEIVNALGIGKEWTSVLLHPIVRSTYIMPKNSGTDTFELHYPMIYRRSVF